MANRLKVANVFSIKSLHEAGWSQRRIAREVGVSRGAVARHLQKLSNDAKASIESADSNGAKAPTGSRSQCEPFREQIIQKLNQGLSAQRIFQDLVEEHGFTAKYHSVRRFVSRLRKATPLPFRRIEVPPGEEAQIDFGRGVPIVAEQGQRRRTHVIRVVLSHSRKAYSEVVYRQTTENLIRCLENAFPSVPKPVSLFATATRTGCASLPGTQSSSCPFSSSLQHLSSPGGGRKLS